MSIGICNNIKLHIIIKFFIFKLIFEIQLDASGRTDESLAVEFVGPLQPSSEDGLQSGKLLSISLQKGQLRANICFQPFHSANLEVSIFKF